MNWYVPLFLILPLLMSKNSSVTNSSSSDSSSYDFPLVEKVANVPFAVGISNPTWPVITDNKRGTEVPYKKTDGKYIGNAARSFGVPRSDGERRHVGIDLYSNYNDVVIATEPGIVINTQGFLGPTKALLIQCDSGLVCLYGEIKDQSWKEFNIGKGSRVKSGDSIARVGKNNAGTSMLHFETYTKGTTKNSTWSKTPPSNIRNPTKYLLQAQKSL